MTTIQKTWTAEELAALEAQVEAEEQASNEAHNAAEVARTQYVATKKQLETAKKYRPEGQEELSVTLVAPLWKGVNPNAFIDWQKGVGLVPNPLGPGSAWAISDGIFLVLSYAGADVAVSDRVYAPDSLKALAKAKSATSLPDALRINDAPQMFPKVGDSYPGVKQVTDRVKGEAAIRLTVNAASLLSMLKAMADSKWSASDLTLTFRGDLLEVESSDAYGMLKPRDGGSGEMAEKLRGKR